MVKKISTFSIQVGFTLALLLMGTGHAVAGQPDQGPPAHVSNSQRNDTSAPLRTIRPNPPRAGEILERPRKMLPNRPGGSPPGGEDPVLQPSLGSGPAPTTDVNFEANNNVSGVLPPDPVGAVGPNHYIQLVNLVYSIYDKTGNRLRGPDNINTVFSGFGGACETSNDGDPVVLYDHLADRWLISQFALPGYPFGPFYQCIAISQTPNPLGAWYRYQFLVSSNKLNDYPKIGVWPDGYYMSVNQFSQLTFNWAGAGVVVFERDKMLQGLPATMVYFDLYNTDRNLGGMLPSDLDGPAPPAGTPNYFAQMDDDAWGYSPDQLQIWKLHADWASPGSSTFTRDSTLPVSSFDSNMCGYSRNCIPQPGGTKLDAISDRLMFRLQYRNFGSYQTLVANHTVDANGSDHAGIRWYELRNSGGGWSVRQQGTFAPDPSHRWMGSIAMDGSGNIALGYSVSSTGVSPSIRYTGRLAGDTLGQMTLSEGTVVNGSGYQTHSSGRWGDYSAMTVDPDDCSFWYTQEYYNSVSVAGWQTRVGAFRIGSCGAPVAPPDGNPTNLNASAVSSSQINLSWTDNSSNESGFKIERCQGAACSNFAQIATVGTGVITYNDTGLTASTDYSYRVRAYNSGGDSDYTNTASATTLSAPSEPAAPSNLTATVSGKTIDLAWHDNSSNEDNFVVERCQVGKRNSCSFSVLATVPANTTTYTDSAVGRRKTYNYRVKATNAAGDSGYSDTATATTN